MHVQKHLGKWGGCLKEHLKPKSKYIKNQSLENTAQQQWLSLFHEKRLPTAKRIKKTTSKERPCLHEMSGSRDWTLNTGLRFPLCRVMPAIYNEIVWHSFQPFSVRYGSSPALPDGALCHIGTAAVTGHFPRCARSVRTVSPFTGTSRPLLCKRGQAGTTHGWSTRKQVINDQLGPLSSSLLLFTHARLPSWNVIAISCFQGAARANVGSSEEKYTWKLLCSSRTYHEQIHWSSSSIWLIIDWHVHHEQNPFSYCWWISSQKNPNQKIHLFFLVEESSP